LAHENLGNDAPPYYMGTLLIHRSEGKSKRFIIDGQQRLTALGILHRQLEGSLPNHFAMTYSPRSARYIRAASETYQASRLPHASIFAQIRFTIIEVERVDLAFTFFDTQNNRGVPLHATDLLKAYHLRAVTGKARERLQTLCASGWEQVQQSQTSLGDDSGVKDSAPRLFDLFLWRARSWTGKQLQPGGHDALIETFQNDTWEAPGDGDGIPLYRSRQNRLGTHLRLKEGGQREVQTHPITLSEQATDLPFAIRQPVHKGIGFFLYAEKYGALLQWLTLEETNSSELIRFRGIYRQLMAANSIYLREIFVLGSLMYVDQFGEERLVEFALWYEHALGAIRLDKQQVRHEAAKNFFRDDDLNLLDVIAGAYLPEQVIGHLTQYHRHDTRYADEQIETGRGVQGRYKEAVLRYFNKSADSLKGKASWVEDLVTQDQEGEDHVV
ncbi:DUF262 domain-containing protein, partial [Akkermansiaceae bacterium]|nr:DUF262 domain-containing protein [Akkermansiaceae bacterium]